MQRDFQLYLSFIVILLLDPIHQNQEYHNFADQRTFFAIPNFFDVTTNILFAFIGFRGMYLLLNWSSLLVVF